MRTVWITKYALTKGIFQAQTAEDPTEGVVTVRWPGGLNGVAYFHGEEWHTSLEAAQARVRTMATAKLKSLKKQQGKLQVLLGSEIRVTQIGSAKC